MEFPIENCSALLFIGGDGTQHEGVNGLLRRKDRKRVPVAFMPNGSGDDAAGGLAIGYNDMEKALSYVAKGQTIKIDVVKVLLDHESEQEIEDKLNNDPAYPEHKKFEDHFRYMIINSHLCLTADVGRNAIGMKKKGLGPTAYTIQTVIELMKRKTEKFDIYMDHQSYFQGRFGEKKDSNGVTIRQEVKTHTDVTSQLLMVYNSKLGAGRKLINPMGLLNDSYFELIFLKNLVGFGPINKLFEGTQNGGVHIYNDDL